MKGHREATRCEGSSEGTECRVGTGRREETGREGSHEETAHEGICEVMGCREGGNKETGVKKHHKVPRSASSSGRKPVPGNVRPACPGMVMPGDPARSMQVQVGAGTRQ